MNKEFEPRQTSISEIVGALQDVCQESTIILCESQKLVYRFKRKLDEMDVVDTETRLEKLQDCMKELQFAMDFLSDELPKKLGEQG